MHMSTKDGFAFLCMPKAGSTSIEGILKKICNVNFSDHWALKHINARDFTKYILTLHEKMLPSVKIESFCIMRNPFEWMESWYRYRSRDEIKSSKHTFHKNYAGNISYDEFIAAYLSKGVRPNYANFGTQHNFMILDNGAIGVDYIFSLDRLDLVEEFLARKTGKDIKIPVCNVSPKKSVELNSKLKEQLIDRLKIDIALYSLVKSEGIFNKVQHSEKFFSLLKSCR